VCVRPGDRIEHNRQRTFGIWKRHYPCIDPVYFVWLERAPGRVRQEKISGKVDISNFRELFFRKMSFAFDPNKNLDRSEDGNNPQADPTQVGAANKSWSSP